MPISRDGRSSERQNYQHSEQGESRTGQSFKDKIFKEQARQCSLNESCTEH